MNFCVSGICVLSFCFVVLCFRVIAALTTSLSVGDMTDAEHHKLIMDSLEGQLALMKWGSAAVISALTTVVGVLYAYSVRQGRMILHKFESWNQAQIKILEDTNKATIEAVRVSEKEHAVLAKLSDAVKMLSRRIDAIVTERDEEKREKETKR